MQRDSSPSPTTSSPLIRPINRKVVRRICSGQVILDLSSAVKELVENSLDAGATSIEINLRDYGKEHFQVTDNGCGICPTNFKVLALKHHTSKLVNFKDPQSVATFGFRGEALSSLCALGNLTVETRTKNERVATLLTFDHSGLLISEKKTTRKIGTTVTVRKLFSNLPVRSKEFKRNIRKEYGKLVSLLNAYALVSKGVRFVCSNRTEKNPKSVVLKKQGRGSLKDNIITLFGMNTFTSLQFVNIRISDDCKVEGFISKPGQGSKRNVADREYFFINGRPVDMPKVSKLFNELYKDTSSRKYPIAILDFAVPHGACDLNVTPNKRKVVFSEESSVIGSLKKGLNEIYSSKCEMEGDNQVDGLVVSKKDDVMPKEMDSELRNRISPETRIDNVERHEREHEKPLCSEEPTSDNKRTETILEDNPRCSQPLRSVLGSGFEKLRAKRLDRLSRSLSTGDLSKCMKNTPQPKKMDMTTYVARRTRSRTESYLNSLVRRTRSNGTKGISVEKQSQYSLGSRTEKKRAAMRNGCSPPSANAAKRRRKRASDDKDVATCTLTPSALEISVTSLSSDEEGSVEELGTDSSVEFSEEDRDSSDSNSDEDVDTESSDYTTESSDYSYIESSESDFDCSDDDDEVGAKERKTPSGKVYTHGKKPKTFPRKNHSNVFELLEKSIWERTEISEEEMWSGDETAEVYSREDATVRESSSEKVHEERKPRSLRRVREKKKHQNSFYVKSCDGKETKPWSTVNIPPLNLRFGCEEEPEPIEKTEEEIETDALWEEMAFLLTSQGVRSSTPAKRGDVPCSNKTHEFILDEEIGLKCRYCSYVSVEIKNISQPMEKYHANVNDKKTVSERKGDHVDNKLDFEGSDQSSHGKASSLNNNNTQGTVWEGIPGIKDTLYQHQQEGFEFIWKNIAGTTKLEELKSSVVRESGGCVISHAPGTGKTRLTIVFLQSYLEQFPDCRPVVIAPASLLLTWEEEFKKWNSSFPFYNLSNPEFSGLEHQKAVSLVKGNRSDKCSVRMVKLYSWKNKESILGVSYHLFEKLAGGRRRQEFRRMLLELPGLMVLDEGHTPRNQNSCIWKVLSEVKTEKRIILSGTPFQNNFKELSNVLCLARPAYTATISSRLQDLSSWRNQEGKKRKIKEFKNMIASFVHVHKGNVLRESLPGLRDCVVVLNPTYQQKKILDRIDSSQKTFEREHKRSSVSVHPSLYLKCNPTMREKLIIGPSVMKTLEKISLDSNQGVKTRFLIDFLNFSKPLNEKVLVFSQYLDTLELIIEQIKLVLKWGEGKEILYMNGRLEQKERQNLISNFNKPDSEAKVLLASTKACSEGINLVGASRVVLLDVVWNPAVESQAISRAYRIGQKRIVYTYHLMVKGTSEWDKYCTQTKKHHISELVFSSSTDEKDKVINKEVVSEDKILDEMVRHEKLKDMFEKILYHPKESDLFTNIL